MKKLLLTTALLGCVAVLLSFATNDNQQKFAIEKSTIEQGDWNYATTSCGEGFNRQTIRLRYKTNGGNGLFALEYKSGNAWIATSWDMADHRFACPRTVYSNCSCFGY